jgi:hypothetical protein
MRAEHISVASTVAAMAMVGHRATDQSRRRSAFGKQSGRSKMMEVARRQSAFSATLEA